MSFYVILVARGHEYIVTKIGKTQLRLQDDMSVFSPLSWTE